MRYFALTAMGSFTIMSAVALCAAHAAMNSGTVSFYSLGADLVKENQANIPCGQGSDAKTGAAGSRQLGE